MSQQCYLARRCLEAHWPDFAEPSNALGRGSGRLELAEQVDVGAGGTTSPRLSGHDLPPGHQRKICEEVQRRHLKDAVREAPAPGWDAVRERAGTDVA